MPIYSTNTNEAAYAELIQNCNYIKYKLNNEVASANLYNQIITKILSLQYFPYRGSIYSNYFTRFIVYKNYLIFYEIKEKEKQVIIKRIIHRNLNY